VPILSITVSELDKTKFISTNNKTNEIDLVIEKNKKINNVQEIKANLIGKNNKDLASAVWLKDISSLEQYASAPEHLTFLLPNMSKIIKNIWTTRVLVENYPSSIKKDYALFFAIKNLIGNFEWEIIEYLDALSSLPGEIYSGRSFEERDQFRAAGVILYNADDKKKFNSKYIEINTNFKKIYSITNESNVLIAS
jgi:hypothetical protein